MGKVIDLTGHTYNRLTVIRRDGRFKDGVIRWLCSCSCGGEVSTRGATLRAGTTKSCGCLQKENLVRPDRTTHGNSGTSIYRTWSSMKSRCTNPTNDNYPQYGARGIKVYEPWVNSFETFVDDILSELGSKPEGYTRYSLDRIDNDGNYEPGNLRWATYKQQNRNSRNTREIEFQGKKQCIVAWAEETGINRCTISSRLEQGWSVEKTLSTPVQKRAS